MVKVDTKAKEVEETDGDLIAKEIDKQVVAHSEDGLRAHLGASVIGRECSREIWGKFRWLKREKAPGRMRRLWQRGHDEEPRLIQLIRSIGGIVQETDPETGKQFRIKAVRGHFGGSGDGKVWNLERFDIKGIMKGPGLAEFKTSGQKYFPALKKDGVRRNKPEHFAQMQTYMDRMGLGWALYMAVNKDDDDLHLETVENDGTTGPKMLDKAEDIINSQTPPARINESPAFYKCKMCDLRMICHYGEAPEKNCRSCINAHPVDDGEWYCDKHKAVIPRNFLRKGCDSWEPIA